MNQQILDKLNEAFEPVGEAAERGEFLGALLCTTFGTGNDSMVWYLQAGNQSAVYACSEYCHNMLARSTVLVDYFNPFEAMVINKELLAAVFLICHNEGVSMRGSGPDKLSNWLIHEHKMRAESLIKTTLAMTLQSQMQQAAQAQLMAQQIAQGKIIRGNGGRG